MKNGMRFSRIVAIARREWISTIRRREFVLVTLGLPLFYALIFALVIGGSTRAITRAEKKAKASAPPVVGFFDPSHQLSEPALRAGTDDFAGKVYATQADGEAAVRDRKIRAFVVLPADFPKTATLTVDLPPATGSLLTGGSLDAPDDIRAAYTRTLRHALLAQRHVSDATANASLQPFASDARHWDAKARAFRVPDPLREISRFAVPYAFSLLLLLSVLFSSSYLLHGIVEEKESRIVETLLSAVTHEELLTGKLIGLGGAGLTQLAVWMVAGLALPLSLPPVRAALATTVTPTVVATAALFFLLGYAFYAAILAGIGAMGTSYRESQQIAGVGVFCLTIPLLFLPVVLEEPNGTLARVLSLLPPTAPIGMMLRVAAGGGSSLDFALAVALLALATALILRLSARLFRLSLLLVGQKPTLKAVWMALVGG